MPYVTREAARRLGMGGAPSSAGDLAFLLSAEVERYVEAQGLGYQTIADVLGGLETTKKEFQDRVAKPYEAAKLSENGADPLCRAVDAAQRVVQRAYENEIARFRGDR